MTHHVFSHNKWTLEWSDDTGEGYGGDYNPDDPDDRLLLRADLSYDGEPCIDGSYCTLAPATTPAPALARMSAILFSMLDGGEPADEDKTPDGYRFKRRTMERWTWLTNPNDLDKVGG